MIRLINRFLYEEDKTGAPNFIPISHLWSWGFTTPTPDTWKENAGTFGEEVNGSGILL